MAIKPEPAAYITGGMKNMSKDIYMRFAKSVRAVVPDFPMSDDEIREILEDEGITGFADSDATAAELVELSELFEHMERRSGHYGAG
jgi:hypothetical protein